MLSGSQKIPTLSAGRTALSSLDRREVLAGVARKLVDKETFAVKGLVSILAHQGLRVLESSVHSSEDLALTCVFQKALVAWSSRWWACCVAPGSRAVTVLGQTTGLAVAKPAHRATVEVCANFMMMLYTRMPLENCRQSLVPGDHVRLGRSSVVQEESLMCQRSLPKEHVLTFLVTTVPSRRSSRLPIKE